MASLTYESMGKVATTIRIEEEKVKLLKAIAGSEGRNMSDILRELIDEYINRYKETLELLAVPGFAQECKTGLEEIKEGGGKTLNELDD